MQTGPKPQDQSSPAAPAGSAAASPSLDREAAELALGVLRGEQSMAKAVLAGAICGAIGAVLWAVVTAVTKAQISWFAIGVGALVAAGVRLAGKGLGTPYRVLSAGNAAAACMIGNFLAVMIMVSNHDNVPLSKLLGLMSVDLFVRVMGKSFQPMDPVFYFLAMSIGWRTAVRTLTQDDIRAAAAKGRLRAEGGAPGAPDTAAKPLPDSGGGLPDR